MVQIFDQDGDGNIDYYEFISALHPRDSYAPKNDAEKIEDEVIREVARCRCCERFAIQQISDNKYRVRTIGKERMENLLMNLNIVNPLDTVAPNLRISSFQKRLRETERS